ncbi:hypothetical protein [Kosakonia radicincitans]|uniref:hypothetical protein n=1 Tax=Kosakonia radicincitans TaxID=283686 RepID=UPI000A4B3020|nr:hypothetical protein [Kosakonia radicincitans]
MTIDELLETILTIEKSNLVAIPNRVTRCRTNPDDSISRAAKQGDKTPVIRHPSSTFYNEFTLFTDID